MLVYVLNKHGKPLMPCSPRKARLLLKSGKAKVVQRTPFTIQLLYGSSGYTQPITLGVDAGSKTVGLSASTEKRELYSAEVELRNDITDLLATRRQYRRSRRNRKTRYRKPRFLNRVRSKKKAGTAGGSAQQGSWLAPSLENKITTHLAVTRKVCELLPVTKIVVEVAAFDLQKIGALEADLPAPEGTDYQHGPQEDFWNVREYVLWRDGHKCQHCHGKSKDPVLQVHHLESRKTGGDAPGNLATLCKTCHERYHAGEIKLKLKRSPSSRDATHMNIMRWTLWNRLKEAYPGMACITFGYITKRTRIAHGLSKSHRHDALCISGHPAVEPAEEWFAMKKVRCHNRQLHKATILKGGVRKRNQAPKYVFGYQLFDKVLYKDQECFIFGRRSSGSFDIRKLDGTKISAGVNYKKLKLLESRRSETVGIETIDTYRKEICLMAG